MNEKHTLQPCRLTWKGTPVEQLNRETLLVVVYKLERDLRRECDWHDETLELWKMVEKPE